MSPVGLISDGPKKAHKKVVIGAIATAKPGLLVKQI